MAKNNIENRLHSEQLNEVISAPPSWLLNNGITWVFLTTLALLGLTYFIHVPETIKSSIRFRNISTETITNRVNAKLVKLFVKNGTYVSSNTTVAYIESSANHQDVLALLEILKAINDTKNTTTFSIIKLPISLKLGELQASYVRLYQVLNGFNKEQAKQDLLFFNILNEFIRKAENWKSKFVLISKTEGKIVFSHTFHENQMISNGQKLFYIYPLNNKSFVELLLPENVRSKFNLGQKVSLKVKEPSNERYRYLSGNIKVIANKEAGKNLFLAKMWIDNTAKNKQLQFANITDAEVIIDNGSMLEKIWKNILKSKKI